MPKKRITKPLKYFRIKIIMNILNNYLIYSLSILVIFNYCDSTNIPQLANASAIIPVNTTVVGINYFKCNNGFESSGGTTHAY